MKKSCEAKQYHSTLLAGISALSRAFFVSKNDTTSQVGRQGLILFCFLITFSILNTTFCYAKELTASWYSIQSLKQEGTYKYTKGVMANGEKFDDNLMCCANRLWPLGSMLRVTNLESGKSVIVKTTDRIGKRFANTRIDLSKRAFAQIANLEQGIVKVKVEVINE